jgi:hypothetical protein
MSVGFHLKAGSKSFEDIIKDIEKRFNPEEFSKMIHIAAYIAVSEAMRLCPVDSGVMRSSISVSVSETGFTLSCSAPYAVFNEYGTRYLPAGTPNDPKYYKSGYRPFLRVGMLRAKQFIESYLHNAATVEAFQTASKNCTWEKWMLE